MSYLIMNEWIRSLDSLTSVVPGVFSRTVLSMRSRMCAPQLHTLTVGGISLIALHFI